MSLVRDGSPAGFADFARARELAEETQERIVAKNSFRTKYRVRVGACAAAPQYLCVIVEVERLAESGWWLRAHVPDADPRIPVVYEENASIARIGTYF